MLKTAIRTQKGIEFLNFTIVKVRTGFLFTSVAGVPYRCGEVVAARHYTDR